MLFYGQHGALSFDTPELLFDMRATIVIIQGKAVKKPMIEVVSSLDFSKHKDAPADAAAPAEDDDGIPTDVDCAAPA
jgi:hypothetical protein